MMRPTGTTDRLAPPSGTFRSGAVRSGTIRKEDLARSLVGQTFLGKYKTVGYLGEGSNAQVFLAHPVKDPTTVVVVKRVKEHVLANPRFRQFFDGEVRSMAGFGHPYVVRLLDASLDDPLGPCLVLDYIPGITLEDL